MAKTTELLTDADCRNAVCPPELKRRRLSDGGSLYLEVSPNGSRRWFFKFYPDGKESRLALGSYPAVSLKEARKARDKARQARHHGTNPVQARRAEKIARKTESATTFEAVARELHATKASGWSDSHAAQWLRCLEKDVFPWVGSLPLADITAPMLLEVFRKVQARGALRMGHDLREYSGQVFRYGIATDRCERNPAADLRGALVPFVERNLGAVLDPAEAGALMRSIDGYKGQPLTRAALVLSALLFQRPGNVRMMEWVELDLDAGLWTIPADKMKRDKAGKANGRPHFVPLAQQAVAALREIQPLSGGGRYVFPSLLGDDRPMSENTIRAALRRMGYGNEDHSAHGFRAMARTLMVERLSGINPEVIEAQLAHGKSGPLGSAYDRAEYMAQRRQMMNTWADYLDQLRDGGKVIPIRQPA
jgi:integrase